MNEAALQLCKLRPILLTNRDLLLKAARYTVRLADYKYSKGHSRSQFTIKTSDLGQESDDFNEGDSLMMENPDSIEIEILDDENKSHDSFDTMNGKSSSSESNKEDQALIKKPFSGLKEQNPKFIIMSQNGGNNVTQDGELHTSSNGNSNGNSNTNSNSQQSREETNRWLPIQSAFEEERRRRLDQIEIISRQIELNSGQIAELRMQLEGQQSEGQSTNENESLSKLLKLEDDQKLLIEEKNNLVKQIQKLHR